MHALRHLSDHAMHMQILQPLDPGWQAAALMIEGHFHDAFDARMTCPRSPGGGAVGLGRGAGGGGPARCGGGVLFTGLSGPAGGAAAVRRSGRAVHDDDILEVVSMACPRPIATLPLIEAIAAEGPPAGQKLGPVHGHDRPGRDAAAYGRAAAGAGTGAGECLPDAACWGRYYDTNPWVCALAERSEPLRFMPRPSAASARFPPR